MSNNNVKGDAFNHLAQKPNGKITFVIEGVKKNNDKKKCYKSQPAFVAGLTWRAVIQTHMTKDKNSFKAHFGFWLKCESALDPVNQLRSLNATFTLLNYKYDNRHVTKEIKNESLKKIVEGKFNSTGFDHFYQRSLIMDIRKGYLHKDSLTFEISFDVLDNLKVEEALKMESDEKEKIEMEANEGAAIFFNEAGFNIGFTKLFNNEHKSDLKIICGEKDGEKVYFAHKLVLESMSTVFETMFSTPMSETNSGTLKIVDFNADTVQEFLRFIYTGRIENFNAVCEQLFIMAHRYQVNELIKICKVKIGKKDVTLENFEEFLDLAELYNLRRVQYSCVNIYKKYKEKIFEKREADLVDFIKNHPKFFLKVLKSPASAV